MSKSIPHVITIGNAIIDILANVDEDFLFKHELNKSTMKLCTREEQSVILADISQYETQSGGSSANTICSLASMGITSGFIGTIGNDHWGKEFERSLKHAGVVTMLETHPSEPTGTSVIVITPDSERTMNTHLGAAAKITHKTFDHSMLKDIPLVYIEGYAYDSPDARAAVESVVAASRRYSQQVALTLSDIGCVQRHKEDFRNLISSVDILLGNEQEFCELFNVKADFRIDDVEQFKQYCPEITVITRSEKGSILITPGGIKSFESIAPTQLIDVTGAGDQFAAGLLYGIATGLDLNSSIRCATVLATEVITKIGPRIDNTKLIDIARNFFSTND